MLSFLSQYKESSVQHRTLQEVRAIKTELSRASVQDLIRARQDATKNSRSLLERLFRPILRSYQTTENHFHLKVALCDLLATWLTKACRACSDVSDYATQLSQELADVDFQALYDSMLTDWDLGGPIHAPLREIFSKSLVLQRFVVPTHKSDQKHLLEAALEMDHMQKSLYYAIEILRKSLGTAAIIECEPNFFRNRLPRMRETTIATPLGRLLANVMHEPLGPKATAVEQLDWLRRWQDPVVSCLQSGDEMLSDNLITYLLPSLFQVSKLAFDQFISDLIGSHDSTTVAIDEDAKVRIAIACLHKAKQVQVIGDLDSLDLKTLGLPSNFFEFILSHGNSAIRASGLLLLVSHAKLTTRFVPGTYDTLQKALSCQFHETDMQLRKEILSGFRAFFMRFQTSIYASITLLNKQNRADDQATSELRQYLVASEKFAVELVRILKTNLEPGTGYQVTYTSLQLLQLASAFGWCSGPSATCEKYASFKTSKQSAQEKPLPFATGIFDEEMTRLLLNCLGNSFDDNRTLALALLTTPSNSILGLQEEAQIRQVIHNADRLVYSTRGRDGDGGARMLQLIFQRFILRNSSTIAADTCKVVNERNQTIQYLSNILDGINEDTKSASTDMLTAARGRPLHGRLTALSYMINCLEHTSQDDDQQQIQAWADLYSRIVKSCSTIWDAIKEVLTDDSPEGNLPASMDTLEDNFLRGQDAQVILSFCWRALRETSNLLTSVITKPTNGSGYTYLTVKDYQIAGELSLSWLTEVRHRGAFSAVFPNVIGISKCLLAMHHSPALQVLPCTWLERNIDELTQLSHRKDITRRSGGLPMSIISLMISDSENASGPTGMVDMAMSRLLALVTTPIESDSSTIELPQVHGLNTLKDIFLESRLAASSIDYVERCFVISIDGFSSPICALIRRSFGSRTSRAESSPTTFAAHTFFARYPLLLGRLTQELQAAVNALFSSSGSVVTTGLHPCLCLLSRLDLVDTSEIDDYSSYEELLRLLCLIATSPVWQIRSIAAQAIPTLVERELVGSFIVQQLNLATTTDQNALHGRLLMIFQLLQYNLNQHTSDVIFVEQILSDLRRAITNKFVELSSENPCATTEALWLRTLIFLARTTHSEQNASLRQRVVDYCARELTNSSSKHDNMVGMTERNSVMTAITLRALADPKFKRFQSSSTSTALTNLIEDERVEVRIQVYNMLEATFRSSAILKSPTLHAALYARSVKESWPIARNAARLCLSVLPESLTSDSDKDAREVLLSYMAELRGLDDGSVGSDVTLRLVGQFMRQIKDEELILDFCLLLHKFSADHQSADTRSAVLSAVRSSDFSKCIMRTAQISEQVLVNLVPVYLSLLTDDDEDIRNNTSELVCAEILGCPVRTPERTREAFLLYLAQKHVQSQLLQNTILQEITGSDDPVHALSVASHPSDQLFATEKQNLWRNSVTNCQQALKALSLMAVSQESLDSLSKWCLVTLEGILHEIESLEQDGPLGWSSIPDTWQIVRRTLLVKDWLLAHDKQDTDQVTRIKDLLAQIAHASQGKSVHPTLIKSLGC